MSLKDDNDRLANELRKAGIAPEPFFGKQISFNEITEKFGISPKAIFHSIDKKLLTAHYDSVDDVIFFSSLEFNHYFYCIRAKSKVA